MNKNFINTQAVNDLLLSADLQLSESAITRLLWLKWYVDHGRDIDATSARFGISRSTFLRWASRFDPLHPERLEDLSKRPKKLRAPETSERVVGIVRFLRELYPSMSKRVIALELERYGEHVSSATVGRVISRYGFFFADTPSHKQKRHQYAARNDASSDASSDGSASGLGFAAPALLVLLTTAVAFLGVFLMPPQSVFAAESTSYQLTADPGNVIAAGSPESINYEMQEVTATWKAFPGQSTNYQIVTDELSSSSSSSSSSSTAAAGVGSTVGDSGGGRRGITRGEVLHPAPGPAPSRSSQPQEPATSQRLSSAPLLEEDTWLVDDEKIVDPDIRNPEIADVAFRREITVNEKVSVHIETNVPQKPRADAYLRQPTALCNDASDSLCHGAAPAAETLGMESHASAVFVILALIGASLLFATRIFAGVGPVCIGICRGVVRFPWWIVALAGLSEERIRTKKRRNKRRQNRHTGRKRGPTITVLILFTIAITCMHLSTAEAATTTPQRMVYNGHLLDSGGSPVTSAVSVRFSFWNSADYQSGQVTSTGALQTASSAYAGWNETHTVTPNSQGRFSLEMGSSTGLPDFSTMSTSVMTSLHLQVEVKASSAANTSYELLDFNTSSETADRSPLQSVPFALNADLLDKREVGTSSGSIAILGVGAVFDPARIPGGTNSGSFVIDRDGSETSPVLQFGSSVSKQLTYDGTNGRFNFSDDVRIEGNLTVTGYINGVDITSLSVAQNTHLKVSSGAGLTVAVAGGGYRLNGSTTQYSGASGVSVQNNATNYVFFGSGGLAVSTIGFPTDESVIQLAQVITSGGAITSVSDKRVLQSDDRERTLEEYFNAGFESAVYQGDGTANIGQLSMSHDSTNLRNFYLWVSSKATLQDYDVVLRVPLSSDFTGWVDNPLRVAYRSTSANATDNRLDISIYDTSGNAVTLSGSTTSLKSTTWATTQVEFASGATWTAGQEFVIKFKLSAKDNYQMHLGGFKLQYKELLGN